MGWLAVACASLIAAYSLFIYLRQHRNGEGKREINISMPQKMDIAVQHTSPDHHPPSLQSTRTNSESPSTSKVPSFDITIHEGLKEDMGPSIVNNSDQPAVGLSQPTGLAQRPTVVSPNPLQPSAPSRLANSPMNPPPSAASSLRVPLQKVLQNTSMQPSKSLTPTSSIMPPGRQVSRKVILEPGHSPLDWAALTNNPKSRLRGKDVPDHLIRVSPSQLKTMNGRKGRDAWTVWQGKVYNITPYVPFHPGGKGEILRGAGKDSYKLFMEVHPWVNWDNMLAECLVGILVSEEDHTTTKNELEEMD